MHATTLHGGRALLVALGLAGALAGCARQEAGGLQYVEEPVLVHRGAEGSAADQVRALLRETARRATADLARPNGYGRYDATRLPLPQAAEATVAMLRATGHGPLVDPLMMDINRGVEIAAGKAMPALEAAIAQLAIPDAEGVREGSDSAATTLLCAQRDALLGAYAPVLDAALAEAGYGRSLGILVDNYNAIPVLSDIDGLVLEPELRTRAVAGICARMAVEEARLRSGPEAARFIAMTPAPTPAAATTAAPAAPAAAVKVGKAEREAGLAVRELLATAGGRAIATLAKPGGYLKSPARRIGLPEPLWPAAAALRDAGLGHYVDELEIDMNVAAEIAAPQAWPLLQQAVRGLQVRDALVVVQGDDTAATRLLRAQAEGSLLTAFRPALDDGLRRTGFIDSHRAFLAQHAALPGARKPVADLETHVLGAAVDGLFAQLGAEEGAIRAEPAKRTTKRLRRAFGTPRPSPAQGE